MEILTDSKVKHIPTGNIIKIKSFTKVFIQGIIIDPKHPDWYSYESTKVRISECETYVEPPKEKSAYELMKERSMESAKKLSSTPKDIGQHILWLKMAVIDRVEKIENLKDPAICTFRSRGEDGKFGFTEQYVNLLMHYAYEAGKQNATNDLTKSYENSVSSMKKALDKIKDALDEADWIDYSDAY